MTKREQYFEVVCDAVEALSRLREAGWHYTQLYEVLVELDMELMAESERLRLGLIAGDDELPKRPEIIRPLVVVSSYLQTHG